ncbi:MAG: Transcriptional regulatory protein ZraR [candidate division BRC1 bacterium ADurb.BinA292]|nr:MAG: Transcriptional regulatory protein ZraR [candidate division BRC1 bacterium ADurb.BinA292]
MSHRIPQNGALAILTIGVTTGHPLRSILDLFRDEVRVRDASDLVDARQAVAADHHDLIALAVDRLDAAAFEDLRALACAGGQPRILVITTAFEPRLVAQFHELGIHDIFLAEHLKGGLPRLIQNEIRLRQLEQHNRRLRHLLEGQSTCGKLLGSSKPMRQIYRRIRKVAGLDMPVLISGESGTELIETAEAIHAQSNRPGMGLLMADCRDRDDQTGAFLFGNVGELPEEGAPHPTESIFACAAGGTVVLQNIECLGRVAQERLLRFLMHPFYQGETAATARAIPRLIVTTSVDLAPQVNQGLFLRALYNRISLLHIRIPALRERREDIPLLANAFLREIRDSQSVECSLAGDALLALYQHDWPGNIAELREVLQAAVARTSTPEIGPEALGLQLPSPASAVVEPIPTKIAAPAQPDDEVSFKKAKREFETNYFTRLLEKASGNMALAARYSRVGRPYLYRKMRAIGLDPDAFRQTA